MANGVVFYQGPSMIDGSPIIGIATFNSSNPKTGNIVSTWILKGDMSPLDAINTGNDSSICGDCPLRGGIVDASERKQKGTSKTATTNKGRGCYVNVAQAPTVIYKAYLRGSYAQLSKEHASKLKDKCLRYGSYGDPVAIPRPAWELLEKLCTGEAAPGYTHQWRNRKFRHWSKRLMASTHSLQECDLAQSQGWRTFRTIVSKDDRAGNEIFCPASEEGGFRRTCATCGACNGKKENDGRVSVVIIAHGGDGKIGNANKTISKINLKVI